MFLFQISSFYVLPLSAGHRTLASAARVLELDHREEGKNCPKEKEKEKKINLILK
jgi:hypothetical protein